MLHTTQIIAFLQGVFLLIFLFKNRKKYQKYNYIFFSVLLISLIFYIIGDDNNSLLLSKYDFFFVDKTLFITVLFLFFKYFNQPIKLRIKNAFFFLPSLIYVYIEISELQFKETIKIEFFEHFLSLIFISYLVLSLFYLKNLVLDNKVKIPFYILIISVLLTYFLDLKEYLFNLPHSPILNNLLIFEISILFYYLTYLFVLNQAFFEKQLDYSKYKNSSLNMKDIDDYKTRILNAMVDDKIFKNQDLSLQTFSQFVCIPKHYISEILNGHLNTNFQDFINQYRVEEFIQLYSNPQNNHFSILGIAALAGFKNKATFNSNFKKFKGISPTEYKKQNS